MRCLEESFGPEVQQLKEQIVKIKLGFYYPSGSRERNGMIS
jgi:hypothetical protein